LQRGRALSRVNGLTKEIQFQINGDDDRPDAVPVMSRGERLVGDHYRLGLVFIHHLHVGLVKESNLPGPQHRAAPPANVGDALHLDNVSSLKNGGGK